MQLINYLVYHRYVLEQMLSKKVYISLATNSLRRKIQYLPKVQAFLSSIGRNSVETADGYKTSLVHFQDFLSSNHNNHTLESILQAFSTDGKRGSIDVYEVLEGFIAFIQQQKKVNASSLNQYLNGIRSYLAYYDVYVIPAKFKRKVKVPKVYREEEQPLDVKDIRQILLNCHNRRLKAYLLVLASAGTRAVEACAIRLRDVDFSTRPTKIHIRKEYAKTRVARDIYISDEATKYLKDWIFFKYRISSNSINDDNNNQAYQVNDGAGDDEISQKRLYNIIKQKPNSLAFQGQINNSHVAPQSIYLKLAIEFQRLLEVSGFNERKEGMKRRKITLHSFRRFVKTTLSDCAGKEYSEWFLGHAKSGYYVSKSQVRSASYAEKCMRYITFLDYSTLEVAEKRVEAQLAQKDQQIELMREQLSLLQERHKQRENEFAELKSAVAFLSDKVNAAIIANESSSKVISDQKGIPKEIEFTSPTAVNAKADITR
jgi:integrase